MAAVSVVADNTRVDDADVVSGWSALGGGKAPTAEASFPYQGANLVNRKITATGGMRYTPTSDGGSAVNMTVPATAHWMVKGVVTDPGGLNANSAVRVQIGSTSNAYHTMVIAGLASVVPSYTEYLPRGGLFIVPVSPNVAGYRSATQGSPNASSVNHFGFEVSFDTSTAKAENVGCDAIDVGSGLTLNGGDGASTDGIWSDFVDADEGTVGNRWGYAQSYNGGAVLVGFGHWTVGGTGPVGFDGAGVILWPDGLFEAGFSGPVFDLSDAASVIHDSATHTSLGTTLVEDTRMDVTWIGTAGTGTANHTVENCRVYTMTSALTLDSANIEVAVLVQNGGSLANSTVRCLAEAGTAVVQAPDLTLISGVIWTQRGAGHAIEITTPGSYTLQQLSFAGFGADESLSAAIYNSSGGHIDIAPSGGTAPTVRNSVGSTTAILSSPVTLTFDGIPNGLECRLRIGSKTLPGGYTASVAGEQFAFSYFGELVGKKITATIGGIATSGQAYERQEVPISLPASDALIPLAFDNNPSYQ